MVKLLIGSQKVRGAKMARTSSITVRVRATYVGDRRRAPVVDACVTFSFVLFFSL